MEETLVQQQENKLWFVYLTEHSVAMALMVMKTMQPGGKCSHLRERVTMKKDQKEIS